MRSYLTFWVWLVLVTVLICSQPPKVLADPANTWTKLADNRTGLREGSVLLAGPNPDQMLLFGGTVKGVPYVQSFNTGRQGRQPNASYRSVESANFVKNLTIFRVSSTGRRSWSEFSSVAPEARRGMHPYYQAVHDAAGKRLICVDAGKIFTFDLASKTWSGPLTEPIMEGMSWHAVALDPDHRKVVIIGADKKLDNLGWTRTVVWDLATDNWSRLPLPSAEVCAEHQALLVAGEALIELVGRIRLAWYHDPQGVGSESELRELSDRCVRLKTLPGMADFADEVHQVVGFYTAPGVPGSYTVLATSQADSSAAGTSAVSIVATETGVVLGTVTSSTGSGLPDVVVSVLGLSAATNGEGYFTIPAVPAAEDAVVSFTKDGYVDGSEITDVVTSLGAFLELTMVSYDQEAGLNAGLGGTVQTSDGGSVDIDGGTLVGANGQPFNGDATVAITTFDPSIPEELDAFPGIFQGVTMGGDTVDFVTYGFMDVTVSATATGEPLNLAGGSTATIEIPIASGSESDAPATIPMWYYDPDDGVWYEEGTFFKAGNVYVGDVPHFSVWNCDVAADRCFIYGRVVDGAGVPVQGARVTFVSHRPGGGYVDSGETSTPADGSFRVPVDANSNMTYWAEKDGVKSLVVGPVPTCDSFVDKYIGDIVLDTPKATITLTWGENPRDLDSHLAVPLAEGGWRVHGYWDAGDGVIEGVALDTDDTSSYGPEIFTIFDWHQGVYLYSVKHFSGLEHISASQAIATLIVPGLGTFTFTPPPGAVGDNDLWRVFKIGYDAGVVTVETVNGIVIDGGSTEDNFLP